MNFSSKKARICVLILEFAVNFRQKFKENSRKMRGFLKNLLNFKPKFTNSLKNVNFLCKIKGTGFRVRK